MTMLNALCQCQMLNAHAKCFMAIARCKLLNAKKQRNSNLNFELWFLSYKDRNCDCNHVPKQRVWIINGNWPVCKWISYNICNEKSVLIT